MSEEGKLQEEISKAARAKAIMEDPLMVEAFAMLEQRLIEGLIATNPRDAIGRENAYRMIHAQRLIRDLLHAIIASGGMAAKELERLAAEAERKLRIRRVV